MLFSPIWATRRLKGNFSTLALPHRPTLLNASYFRAGRGSYPFRELIWL
jgi:hypothetical protein